MYLAGSLHELHERVEVVLVVEHEVQLHSEEFAPLRVDRVVLTDERLEEFHLGGGNVGLFIGRGGARKIHIGVKKSWKIFTMI